MVTITRARASKPAVSTAKKAPAKKAATAKPATKPAAKRTAPAKPRSTARKAAAPVVQETAPVKRRGRPSNAPVAPPTLTERRQSINPRQKVAGLTYQQIADLTGYGLGSEHFIVAVEVLKGGETRVAVNHRVAAMLPATTRNGSPKQVSNLVSAVVQRMIQNGFTVKGSWSMVKPGA